MSSSLGFFGSQISGHLFTLTGSYDALATVTVPSGGASSITFSALPQTGYKHLQLRFMAKDNRGTGSSYFGIRFNNDTGSNYRNHFLTGNGSSASSGTDGTLTRFAADGIPDSTANANTFGTGILDILDYTSTTKNKTLRMLNGWDNNGSGAVWFYSGLWFATPAAITSMTILDQSSGEGTFSQYSTFSLYGVK